MLTFSLAASIPLDTIKPAEKYIADTHVEGRKANIEKENTAKENVDSKEDDKTEIGNEKDEKKTDFQKEVNIESVKAIVEVGKKVVEIERPDIKENGDTLETGRKLLQNDKYLQLARQQAQQVGDSFKVAFLLKY